MKRIAVINQKGGVGKTTTTANTGAALGRMGYKVLLIDMDPQANLTVHLDQSPDLEQKTLTRLLVDDTPLEDLVLPASAENLFIVPADTSLAGVEQVLANRIGRETILREALEAFPQAELFDYCLLDCPPSLGVLSANALVAADRVLVPVQAEYLSLQGMAKLMEVIELVQKRLTPGLEIACILACMVDQRTNLSAEVLAEIEQHFGELLAKSRIRSNVKLAEAPSFGRSIFDHAPESNGAADYAAFAAEFVTLPSIRALGPDRVLDEEQAPTAESPAEAEEAPAESAAETPASGPIPPATAQPQPPTAPSREDSAPPLEGSSEA